MIGTPRVGVPATTAAGRPSPVRLLALVALGAFGALEWATLVAPSGAQRTLPAVAVALAGGLAVAAGGRLPRGTCVAAAAVAAALTCALAAVVAGLPLRLLAPSGWAELGQGLTYGIGVLPEIPVPYRGEDIWPRVVILAGGALLLALAAIAVCWPRRARSGGLGVAVLALAVLYAVPVIEEPPSKPFVHGAAFLVLVAALLWLDRIRARNLSAAGLLLAGAVGLSLAAAAAIDPARPWVRYESIADTLSRAPGASFSWDHRYGPITWSRQGREVLRIKASSPAYWKAQNLDAFDGLRWRQARTLSGEVVAPAYYTRPEWTQTLRVGIRDLRSSEFVGAGTTILVGDSEHTPLPAGSLGTFMADAVLKRGDSYTARVYTPRPSAAELRQAGTAYPPFTITYLSVSLPRQPPGGYASRPRGTGFGEVTFGAFGSAERPQQPYHVAPANADADAEQSLRDSPYAGAYDLARRLAAGSGNPYEYVRNVEAHFRRGFTYTELAPTHDVPLAAFLDRDRRGYCQQFSGAMALLLRMGGVPARVATGFAPGSYDRKRGEYVVRDFDAHSWVEAYFPRYGWVQFDPTPASAPAGSQAATSDTASAATPDPRDLGGGGSAGGDRPVTGRAEGRDPPIAALVIAGFAGLLAALAVVAWRRWRARSGRGAPGHGDPLIAELTRALRRSGHPAAPAMTLRGLERRFGHEAGAAEYLRAVAAGRYGAVGGVPTAAQRQGLRRALAGGSGLRARLRALWALPPRARGPGSVSREF